MKPSVKIALFVVFFLAVAAIGGALYYYNLKPADLQNAAPDYIMSSTDLQLAFENNELEATNKYVNKVIEVTGKVMFAFSGDNNSLTISLETGNSMSFVICTLQIEEGTINPNVGEIITIRGTCSGVLMDVLMNNCAIIVK